MWYGTLVSCLKNFGKLNPKSCMNERLLKWGKAKSRNKTLINLVSELYGPCRHKANFHIYYNYLVSTDEDQKWVKKNIWQTLPNPPTPPPTYKYLKERSLYESVNESKVNNIKSVSTVRKLSRISWDESVVLLA